MIPFTCPCGESLQAEEAYAGRKTRCPACGRDLDIPAAAAVRTADAARVPAPPTDEGLRRSRPHRGGVGPEDRTRPATTSGLAVGSLILGILSLFLCSVFTGPPAVIMGAMGLRAIGRGEGRVRGKGLAVAGLVTGALSFLLLPVLAAVAIGLLLPAVQQVRQAAGRVSSANNLKIIEIGMHSYHDANNTFPPAAICDKKGKPLLSWRVAVLPYIEQSALYNQFKLDEPWDGPNNSKLMPKTYALPNDTTAAPGHTFYRVFVGKGPELGVRPAFEPCRGAGLTEIIDGASNTILVAESATAVPWTKPDEMVYDPDGPLPPLGGHFSGGFYLTLGASVNDVKFITSDVKEQTLRAAITRSGGETLPPDW